MKTKLVAVAAAIASIGSAHALTPAQLDAARGAGTLKEIYVSGASALRLSFAAAVQERCNPADFDVFYNNAAGAAHRAYSCTLANAVGAFPAGTPVLVYKRDQGGSGQGVNPVARATPIDHMVVNSAACTPTALSSPATDTQAPTFLCGTVAPVVSHAGISDVEPALLQATINLPTGSSPLTPLELGNLDVAPMVQALFGVAVNKKAYRALQEAQGIIPPGASMIDVPANQNNWTAADIATIPSLPTEFVRSYLTTGGLAGGNTATGKRGWNIVIPASVDPQSETKTLNVCRRVEGSGTQAASNAFFAYNPCNAGSGALTPLGVAGSTGNSPTFTVLNGTVVQENPGSGGVEACLASVEALPGAGYALGILGRENNPQVNGTDRGYRFVKLDGIAPVRNEAKAGNYHFVYESTMQWNKTVVPAGSDMDSFLRALRTSIGAPTSLAKVDVDTQQGVMSPPASYTGPYASATGDVALFASRASRVSNNSCAPIRITK